MHDELISLSGCVIANRPQHLRIAYHAEHYFSAEEFSGTVKFWVERFRIQPFQRYGLYTEEAYPFAIILFALFHAGKEVWLAANNRPNTAQQLQQEDCHLIGDWVSIPFDYHLNERNSKLELLPLDLEQTRLTIFTSGSTGKAKAIEKRLSQFECEIINLEKQWGRLLGNSQALATVSHQHIYGLLFRVLWSLSANRCFHSSIYLSPEALLFHLKNIPTYWISSPAQLKRLNEDSPWQEISKLNVIFSSGGELPIAVKERIAFNSLLHVLEIYGSSETGGIAWRQYDSNWQLFDGLNLFYKNDCWQLTSPYLFNQNSIVLDDVVQLEYDEKFRLLGRFDRIVKIEEKRISLTEIEQCLIEIPLIENVVALKISTHREMIATVVVLSKSGQEFLQLEGRNAFIKKLRSILYLSFESLVLPKRWLFLNQIPTNTQGKIDISLLKMLFELNPQKFPQIQALNLALDKIEISLTVSEKLSYFANHFANYPILPGVVQVGWADYFAKLFFELEYSFSSMEMLKFIKRIQPNDQLILLLTLKSNPTKLHFEFNSIQGVHSSGRLV
jgi:acyl-coenzyme A synthetase/AMP-(fatty) acid ligase/3-hydroxymyristoyl/3-hydroxydecanoyl-(acyl carrier protein) dehydratase